ncbi:hypothetical protein J6590_075817 [Homalodisca vitripennis]|nr:hypothetical protein J6590_075817 [Homalodisca vitripennis]
MIQKSFGDECMGTTQVKEWYRRFKNGRTCVGGDSNTEHVRLTIGGEDRLTQKNLSYKIVLDNLKIVSDDENILKKIITGDEIWVYGYDQILILLWHENINGG